MQPVEAVRVEVVPDAVASPALSAARVRSVASGVGPAHPQVGRLSGDKVVHLVDHQLKVPLLVLGRALGHTQEDVGPHTGGVDRKKKMTAHQL